MGKILTSKEVAKGLAKITKDCANELPESERKEFYMGVFNFIQTKLGKFPAKFGTTSMLLDGKQVIDIEYKE